MEEQLAKATRFQQFSLLVSAILSPVLCWYALMMFTPGLAGFGYWVVFLILSWVGVKVMFVSSKIIAFFLYIRKLVNQVEEEPSQIELEVLDASDPIGSYLDEDIYEWIDVKVGEEVKRATWKSTFPMDGFQPIPFNCILIPPGLLYEFDEKLEESESV